MNRSEASTIDRTNTRTYFRELGASLVAYVALVAVATTFVDDDGSSLGNVGLMLLPVVPAIGIAWACLRMLKRSDEFVRSRQLEAIAIGFVLAMLASVTLGFVVNVVDVPAAPWIIYVVGMMGWGLASIVRIRA